MEGLKVTAQSGHSFGFEEAPSLQEITSSSPQQLLTSAASSNPASAKAVQLLSSSTAKAADQLQLAEPSSSHMMKGFNLCNGVSLPIPVEIHNGSGDDNDDLVLKSAQFSPSLELSPMKETPLLLSEYSKPVLLPFTTAGSQPSSPSNIMSSSSSSTFHSTGQCMISDYITPSLLSALPSSSPLPAPSKPFHTLEVVASISATLAEITDTNNILTTVSATTSTASATSTVTVDTTTTTHRNSTTTMANDNSLAGTNDLSESTLRPCPAAGEHSSIDISNSILNSTNSCLEEGHVDRLETNDQKVSPEKNNSSCKESQSTNSKANQNQPNEEIGMLSPSVRENDDSSSDLKGSTTDDKMSILSTSSSEFFPTDFPSFDPLMTLRLGQFSYSPFSDIFPLSYSSSMAQPAVASQGNGRTTSSSVETVPHCESRKSSQVGGFLSKLKEALPVRLTSGGRERHAHIERSTTALILQQRQPGLPSKDPEEEAKHRLMYESMVEEVKRKEKKDAKKIEERMKFRLKVEELTASALKVWKKELLPCWEDVKNNYQTKQLWWHGIPPSIRGTVWKLVIGNELNITRELYEICLSRFQELLKSSSLPPPSTFPQSTTVVASAVVAATNATSTSQTNDGRPLVDGPLPVSNCNEVPEKLSNGVGECPVSRESSVELIRLDVSRTFPSLCIFQKAGPYHEYLQGLLGSYVCYRPDVGYVQGMSFVAAILLLNMDAHEAFVCFANLLNRPIFIAFFRLDADLMKTYFDTYNFFFKANLPKLYRHFNNQKLTADLYIIDWVFSLYSKCFNLDIVSRIWDVFFRDGEQFLFRTALGILKLFQPILVNMDFIQMAQFLVRPPESQVDQGELFQSIEGIDMESKGLNFKQALEHFKLTLTTTKPGDSC